MEIPADLKYITPYIQRGQELTTRDPIVSYYGERIVKDGYYKHLFINSTCSAILCCQVGYCKRTQNQRNKRVFISFT